MKQLNILFKDYLQVTPSITKVIRLGKRDEKPRLLKVSVTLADQKSAILRNKAKLKKHSNPEHIKSIFISPDYTPLEQKKRKALREQLKKMNNVANLYVCYKKWIHSVEKEGQLSQPSSTDNGENSAFNDLLCSNSQLSNLDLTIAVINCQSITAKKLLLIILCLNIAQILLLVVNRGCLHLFLLQKYFQLDTLFIDVIGAMDMAECLWHVRTF